MDAPHRELSIDSSLSHHTHARPSKIAYNAEGQIPEYHPSFGSAVCATSYAERGKRDYVETQPVNQRNSIGLAHDSVPILDASQPVDSTPSRLQYPKVPVIGPSITGLAQETKMYYSLYHCVYFL